MRLIRFILSLIRVNLEPLQKPPQKPVDMSTPIFDDVEAWYRETEAFGRWIMTGRREE